MLDPLKQRGSGALQDLQRDVPRKPVSHYDISGIVKQLPPFHIPRELWESNPHQPMRFFGQRIALGGLFPNVEQGHSRTLEARQYSHYGRTADTFHPAYYQQARRKHGPRAARGNEAFRPAFCHRTGSYYYGGVYLIAHSSRRILIGGDDLTALHHLYVCITGTLQIWFQLIRTAHKEYM